MNLLLGIGRVIAVPIALLLSRPLIEHLPIGFEWVGKPSMLVLSPMEDLRVDFGRVIRSLGHLVCTLRRLVSLCGTRIA